MILQVVEQAIDLTMPFLEPQLLYFHLSATLSPSGAPEIGRLVNYMLLAASTQTERKHPVFLVIDEFQRMVAGNLEYMLQLARSMGVGVILANQSMEDLKKSSVNLIPPIEGQLPTATVVLRLMQRRSRTTDQEQR
jgi:type IV secretory pathway TraG/TraD family ATPase VirD4